MGSNSFRPGDLRLVDGSPPSRWVTTCVVRLSPLTLLMPATYRPSHFTRNLKFLYGSFRWVFTLNCAMRFLLSSLSLSSHLLDLDDDELGRLQRREAHHDVYDSVVDVRLSGGFVVALHEIGLLRRRSLECALHEEVLHERSHVETDLRPQRRVVRFEDHPLRAAEQAFLHVERQAAHGNIFVIVGQLVGAEQRPRAPTDRSENRKRTERVDAERIQNAVLAID